MATFLSKDGKFYMREGKLLGYTPMPATLAANNSWYKGTTDSHTITAIEIKDSYTPNGTPTESWNADVDNSGSIKAYVEGKKLIIAGNGAGKIMANADSSYVFSNDESANSFRDVITMSGLNLLDTSNATNMEGMFWGCGSLTNLDISKFNTSKVTSMLLMFNNCYGLTNLNVSSFNTSNVTNMGAMFGSCVSLINLNLSNFNTRNVASMANMFDNCGSLTSLDLSNFNTAKVTNMANMFRNCQKLQKVELGLGFKFVGTNGYLPAPSSEYISGATGKWYDPNGIGYAPEELNSATGGTYTAIMPLAGTWTWKQDMVFSAFGPFSVNFSSNNNNYTQLSGSSSDIKYDSTTVATLSHETNYYEFTNEEYRTISFRGSFYRDTNPVFYDWFIQNARKLPDLIAGKTLNEYT